MNQTHTPKRSVTPSPSSTHGMNAANPVMTASPSSPIASMGEDRGEGSASTAPSPSSPSAPSRQHNYEHLLSLYLDEALTLADIAFSLGISITEAIARTTDPDFIAFRDAYAKASDQRHQFLSRNALAVAARTFTRLAEESDKPETARKAAGALARMHAKPVQEPVTHDHRIRAAAVFARHPQTTTLTLLTPIFASTPIPKAAAA